MDRKVHAQWSAYLLILVILLGMLCEVVHGCAQPHMIDFLLLTHTRDSMIRPQVASHIDLLRSGKGQLHVKNHILLLNWNQQVGLRVCDCVCGCV